MDKPCVLLLTYRADMKSNQTPVGPVCSNFPKEKFSTLAELIKIIVDKKLYLLSIPWPSEDIRPYLDSWEDFGSANGGPGKQCEWW